MTTLHARWLGRVPYREAWALQRALHRRSTVDHLLLLEHPHVYTLGSRSSREHLLVDPATVGAECVDVDRGGDVTYHGPGQLVAYPIVTLPEWRGGMTDVVRYVRDLEAVLIAALADLGQTALTEPGLTGVWVDGQTAGAGQPGPGGAGAQPPEATGRPRKIAAIGVKVSRGRTMHGIALNVSTDLAMFDHIVPCGIRDRGVTSLEAELGRPVEMRSVADAFARRFAERFGHDEIDRHDVAWRIRPEDLSAFSRGAGAEPGAGPGAPAGAADDGHEGSTELRPTRGRAESPLRTGSSAQTGARVLPSTNAPQPVRLLGRLAEAGVVEPQGGRPARTDRPEWMRVRARLGGGYQEMKQLVGDLGLTTVCEEAGCPNIYECWGEHRTATFMVLGQRCTRACGFCLVDTRKPGPPDADEPARIAEAVVRLGLAHVVITCVARDDLPDGGAAHFAATIAAVRPCAPATTVEVLISDVKGDEAALATIFEARPDVLNHNQETVARLQRAARPSAGYARSLTVLSRAVDAGLATKSGLIVGMGETVDEVHAALIDLRSVGVELLTVGQYLQPTAAHLPVVRWWHPDEFAALGELATTLGFAHVEAGPLVRSSYHAKAAVTSATSAASIATAR